MKGKTRRTNGYMVHIPCDQIAAFFGNVAWASNTFYTLIL